MTDRVFGSYHVHGARRKAQQHKRSKTHHQADSLTSGDRHNDFHVNQSNDDSTQYSPNFHQFKKAAEQRGYDPKMQVFGVEFDSDCSESSIILDSESLMDQNSSMTNNTKKGKVIIDDLNKAERHSQNLKKMVDDIISLANNESMPTCATQQDLETKFTSVGNTEASPRGSSRILTTQGKEKNVNFLDFINGLLSYSEYCEKTPSFGGLERNNSSFTNSRHNTSKLGANSSFGKNSDDFNQSMDQVRKLEEELTKLRENYQDLECSKKNLLNDFAVIRSKYEDIKSTSEKYKNKSDTLKKALQKSENRLNHTMELLIYERNEKQKLFAMLQELRNKSTESSANLDYIDTTTDDEEGAAMMFTPYHHGQSYNGSYMNASGYDMRQQQQQQQQSQMFQQMHPGYPGGGQYKMNGYYNPRMAMAGGDMSASTASTAKYGSRSPTYDRYGRLSPSFKAAQFSPMNFSHNQSQVLNVSNELDQLYPNTSMMEKNGFNKNDVLNWSTSEQFTSFSGENALQDSRQSINMDVYNDFNQHAKHMGKRASSKNRRRVDSLQLDELRYSPNHIRSGSTTRRNFSKSPLASDRTKKLMKSPKHVKSSSTIGFKS
mmetsp:Transcript_45984/g.53054  ORF Transcript_45984/g.53054 Transcript_45984/m.53054 type:complete len:603 (-) Transcript_45984:416-2224(-)